MKSLLSFLALASVLATTQAGFASGTGDIGSVGAAPAPDTATAAKILFNAQIAKIDCHDPLPLNHEDSSAGQATVISQEGDDTKTIEMRIVISRFVDEKAEAKALCAELKSAMKSKRGPAIIFQEKDISVWKNNDWVEEKVYDILGTKRFYGVDK